MPPQFRDKSCFILKLTTSSFFLLGQHRSIPQPLPKKFNLSAQSRTHFESSMATQDEIPEVNFTYIRHFHLILPLLFWFIPLWFQSPSKGIQEPDFDPLCCQPRLLFPRPNGKSWPFWNYREGNPKNSFQIWDHLAKPMAKHVQELAISPNHRMAELVQENAG